MKLVVCHRVCQAANCGTTAPSLSAARGRAVHCRRAFRGFASPVRQQSPRSLARPRGLHHDFRHWLAVMSAEPDNAGKGAEEVDFKYWRLWVSADGHTHVAQCSMSGFELVGYSKSPQAVRQKGIPEPTQVIFTELPAEFDNPWHHCPCSQFVMVTQGSWFVRTTDGTEVSLGPNDMLYQDNTSAVEDLVSGSTVENAGQHCSGTGGDKCQQVIIQVERAPRLDESVPF